MTNILKLSTLALTMMLGLSGAAQADGVKIFTTGKNRDALRIEVVEAARSVCEQAVETDIHDTYGSLDECVAATVDATFSKLANTSTNLALANQIKHAH